MNIINGLKFLKKRINYPVYSFLIFAIALGSWSFFSVEKNVKIESLQLSSFAEKLAEVHETEYETINRLTDQQVLKELEKSKVKWSLGGKEEFSVSPEEVEKIEKRHKNKLPKRFKDNPAFKLFEQLNNLVSEKAQTTVVDPALCEQSRQVYEMQLDGRVRTLDDAKKEAYKMLSTDYADSSKERPHHEKPHRE